MGIDGFIETTEGTSPSAKNEQRPNSNAMFSREGILRFKGLGNVSQEKRTEIQRIIHGFWGQACKLSSDLAPSAEKIGVGPLEGMVGFLKDMARVPPGERKDWRLEFNGNTMAIYHDTAGGRKFFKVRFLGINEEGGKTIRRMDVLSASNRSAEDVAERREETNWPAVVFQYGKLDDNHRANVMASFQLQMRPRTVLLAAFPLQCDKHGISIVAIQEGEQFNPGGLGIIGEWEQAKSHLRDHLRLARPAAKKGLAGTK